MEYIVNGAIGVSVYNLKQGRNFLPFISDLKDRVIKYIDVVYDITDTSDVAINATLETMTLSLCKKDTNEYVFDGVSAENFCPMKRYGMRQFIGYKLDLEKSFLNADSYAIGKNTFLVFYYQDEHGMNPSSACSKVSSSPVYFGSSTMNYFPENRTLVDKHFTGIHPPVATLTADGTSTSMSEIQGMFINLVRGSNMFVRNVPLALLARTYQMVNYIAFDGVQIDFTNSFIQLAPSSVSSCDGYGLVLDYVYND